MYHLLFISLLEAEATRVGAHPMPTHQVPRTQVSEPRGRRALPRQSRQVPRWREEDSFPDLEVENAPPQPPPWCLCGCPPVCKWAMGCLKAIGFVRLQMLSLKNNVYLKIHVPAPGGDVSKTA